MTPDLREVEILATRVGIDVEGVAMLAHMDSSYAEAALRLIASGEGMRWLPSVREAARKALEGKGTP